MRAGVVAAYEGLPEAAWSLVPRPGTFGAFVLLAAGGPGPARPSPRRTHRSRPSLRRVRHRRPSSLGHGFDDVLSGGMAARAVFRP